MSIDRTQRLQPVSTVQPRETPADNPLQPRKAAVAETAVSGTQVKLSEAQARLMQPGTRISIWAGSRPSSRRSATAN